MGNQADRVSDKKNRCFVVMGFGTKTDLATGRAIDLNKSYNYLIKPVLKEKNVVCVRADEIPHSGVIDVPMYQELLTADLVIADISTANANAIYELGIRHALRPSTTIVISENKLTYPFDLNHVLITGYTYLEGGIDYAEVLRFQKVLGDMIDEVLRNPKTDSPVYTYLTDLHPPSLAEKVAAAVAKAGEALEAAGEKLAVEASRAPAPSAADPTLAILIQMGEQSIESDDFDMARGYFGRALSLCKGKQTDAGPGHRDDPYLIQRLALATYQSKQPDDASAVKALNEALDVLAPLRPFDSNDPETVGLAGAIEKRLFDKGQGLEHLTLALRHYSRGYHLRDDYYNGINLAYLLNVRADSALDTTDADRIADVVVANRTRREVLALCDRELKLIEERRENRDKARASGVLEAAGTRDAQQESDWKTSFWCLATKAEAHFGLGEAEDFQATRALALALQPAPAKWMVNSFNNQIGRLKVLLEKHGHLLSPPWSPFVP